MEDLGQTLTITLWGMGLTFAAIGLLVVAMLLLTRWTRERQPRPEAVGEESLSAEELAAMEQAAAAAVAIALAMAGRRAHPSYAWHSSRAEEEPSAWQAYARHQQLEQYKTHQSLRW